MLTNVDGREFEPPQYFERMSQFNESNKTVGTNIIREMGACSEHIGSPEFANQRQLFENHFVRSLGEVVHYQLVRREYEVLERWRTGRFNRVDVVGALVYEAASRDQ
jgi:hypothetical protein